MRSASPPRDGPDSDYDGNKQRTPACPQQPHILFAHIPYLNTVATHSNLSDATFLCLSVARAIEHAHRNQSGRNSIHCSLQANRMASDNIPLCSFISFISACCPQHAGDPVSYNRQFNCVYLLAQSVHLHLHTDHTEH